MRQKKYLILIIICCVALTGCRQVRRLLTKRTSRKKPSAQKIEKIRTPELAKEVLKRKKPKLDVTRDPFKPLFAEDDLVEDKEFSDKEVEAVLKEIELLGVVKIDGEYHALLKIDGARKMYKKDDTYKNFTVIDVQKDNVEISNGVNNYKLKRGVEN